MLKIIFLIISLFLFFYFLVITSMVERLIKKLKNKENKSLKDRVFIILLKVFELFVNSILLVYVFTVLLSLILFLTLLVIVVTSD